MLLLSHVLAHLVQILELHKKPDIKWFIFQRKYQCFAINRVHVRRPLNVFLLSDIYDRF